MVVGSAGFPKNVMDSIAEPEVIDDEMVSKLIPERAPNSYKGTFGSVLVVGEATFIQVLRISPL